MQLTIPRALGGTLIITYTPSNQSLHYINVIWVTRDMFAIWKTRG